MSQLNHWDPFCDVINSRQFIGSNFLIVIVKNREGEEVPNVRNQSQILEETREVTIILDHKKRLSYEGIEKIVNELNCPNQVKYILLVYLGNENYANKLRKLLRQSNRLMRKNLPIILSLPHRVQQTVSNPAY